MSYITSTLKVTHQGEKEEFDAFCEFMQALAQVVEHTPYQVELVEEDSSS